MRTGGPRPRSGNALGNHRGSDSGYLRAEVYLVSKLRPAARYQDDKEIYCPIPN